MEKPQMEWLANPKNATGEVLFMVGDLKLSVGVRSCKDAINLKRVFDNIYRNWKREERQGINQPTDECSAG